METGSAPNGYVRVEKDWGENHEGSTECGAKEAGRVFLRPKLMLIPAIVEEKKRRRTSWGNP